MRSEAFDSTDTLNGDDMSIKIRNPVVITATGSKPKQIEEFIRRVNSNTTDVSTSRMKRPPAWKEPGRKSEFNECTLVLKGIFHVETRDTEMDIREGQAVIVEAGTWVSYSTPAWGGAEYIAIGIPGFSPEMARRDEDG